MALIPPQNLLNFLILRYLSLSLCVLFYKVCIAFIYETHYHGHFIDIHYYIPLP